MLKDKFWLYHRKMFGAAGRILVLAVVSQEFLKFVSDLSQKLSFKLLKNWKQLFDARFRYKINWQRQQKCEFCLQWFWIYLMTIWIKTVCQQWYIICPLLLWQVPRCDKWIKTFYVSNFNLSVDVFLSILSGWRKLNLWKISSMH